MRQFLLASLGLFALAPAVRAADDPPAWIEPMKEVHAKFTGKPGTLALFGDSITDTKAFWAPLAYAPKDLPPDIAGPLDVVKKHMLDDCWGKWRGGAYGNESGQTAKWAASNVDKWLKKLNPECAVILFGTNDITRSDVKAFDKQMRAVVEKCLKNGTVVILTTVPPRAGQEDKAKTFAEATRAIATGFKLPLIDYHAEVLKRRPDDWNGALPKFKEFATDVYQVPTLISGDGVHPSNPSKFADYSAEALKSNGYQLRNVLTLRTYADVVKLVLTAKDEVTARASLALLLLFLLRFLVVLIGNAQCVGSHGSVPAIAATDPGSDKSREPLLLFLALLLPLAEKRVLGRLLQVLDQLARTHAQRARQRQQRTRSRIGFPPLLHFGDQRQTQVRPIRNLLLRQPRRLTQRIQPVCDLFGQTHCRPS